jgi:hypothetical protein
MIKKSAWLFIALAICSISLLIFIESKQSQSIYFPTNKNCSPINCNGKIKYFKNFLPKDIITHPILFSAA